jgi:uncharacterized protein (TIGR02453 family)
MPITLEADAVFSGFGPRALSWFRGLEADNSKRYFEASREIWDGQVRAPMVLLLEELAGELGGTVRLFRQHRDVRFAKDKSPYKTTTYGVVVRPGSEAGVYAEISAAGLFAGTGYHDMATDQLTRFRAAVDAARAGASLDRALAEVVAAGLSVQGEAMKTVPRGYHKDHPRAILLRHKALVVGRLLKGARLRTREALDHVRTTFRSAAPLVAWLDAHVGPSSIPPEIRWGRGRA